MLVSDALISALVFFALLSLPDMRSDSSLASGDIRLVVLGIVAALVWPMTLDRLGLYASQRRTGLWAISGRLVVAGTATTAILAITAFLVAAPVVRGFPFVCGVAQLLALGLFRLTGFSALRVLRRHGQNYRYVLIVGTGNRATQAQTAIRRHPEWGLRVAGFVDQTREPVDPSLLAEKVYKIAETPHVLREQVVDEVILACPVSMLASVGPLVEACTEAGVPMTLLSDLFGDDLPPPQVTRFGSLLALSFAPVHHNRLLIAVKRFGDILGASILLLLAAPTIALAALLVRATSPGPAFFRQTRCGLYGRRFEFLKLRTMQVGAEERRDELLHLNEVDGPVFKIRNDPRITPVGRLLRRWSVDELPQFWNVLKGDMSLVGPRPPLPCEVDQYATAERRRLSMRPGITCLWQVSGRNEIGFEDWVKLDLEYIDSWSLGKDAEILLKTIPAVLRGTGS